MIERLSRRKRNVALFAVAVLVVWFAWSIRSVLNPLLVGYLLAYILHPLVVRIEELGTTRRTAVNLTFIGGLVVAAGLITGVALQVRTLGLELYRSATETQSGAGPESGAPGTSFRNQLQTRLDEFTERLQGWGFELERIEMPDLSWIAQQVGQLIDQYGAESLQVAGRGAGFVAAFLADLLRIGGWFVLVPLYTYYFLFVLKRIHGFVTRYLPKRDRTRISRVGTKIGAVIANFFRGRLTVCFLKGLILSVGLLVLGVPYAFLFGMLSGLLSIVPFFGPFLGFTLATVVAIVDHGVFGALWRTAAVFGVAELLEGYVLLPKILGDSLGLHPLVVFIALLAGGAAFGMLGVLIALPVTASVVILFEEFVLPALKDWADEDARAEG